MTQQTVEVFRRTVYGAQNVYPHCETAKAFTRLTNRKTFTPSDLTHIRELGYAITEVRDPEQRPL